MIKKIIGFFIILLFLSGCNEKPKDIPSLIGDLGSQNIEVVNKSSTELQNIGKPAVPHLITAINDSNPSVRKNTAFLLGKIGDNSCIEPLTKLLEDEDYNVRDAAAWSLGITGDKKALLSLKEALKKEKNKKVRKYLLEAIGKLERK